MEKIKTEHRIMEFIGTNSRLNTLLPPRVFAVPFPLMRFGLVWFGFYGISIIAVFLMPNPVYTYIVNMNMIYKHIQPS